MNVYGNRHGCLSEAFHLVEKGVTSGGGASTTLGSNGKERRKKEPLGILEKQNHEITKSEDGATPKHPTAQNTAPVPALG